MNISRFLPLLMMALPLLTLEAAEDKTPARSARQAPVVSPTIHGGGSVTFRIKAPCAKEVLILLGDPCFLRSHLCE